MKAKKVTGIILTIAVLAACVAIVIMLTRGETKTSGNNPANVTGQSLVCESDSIRYPITEYDNSQTKDFKIIANFYDDELSSISLTYALYYNNTEQINASEAFNHADMNISFSKDGLSADAFNAHYSKMEDSMKMTLYATKNDLTVVAAKYFMINAHNKEDLPDKPSEFQKNYETRGLICEINN